MSQGGPPVSRTRKALITAAFNYANFALGLLVSFALTRYLVDRVGAELYGAWLAAAAFLGYAQLADLGVVGIYPWLIAEADGARDEGQLRRLIGQGPWLGLSNAFTYLAVAGAFAWAYPSFVKPSAAARAELAAPIAAFIAFTAATFAVRWALGVVGGLQDAAWAGGLNLVQPLLQTAFVVALTASGRGAMGMALGASAPLFLVALMAVPRLRVARPSLFRLSLRPDAGLFREVYRQGSGAWLGAVGWLLATASDVVILGYLGMSPAIAAYSVTGRLATTLMNIAWVLPDSANVGLAHLNAEGNPSRVGEVVATLASAHLLIIGGVVCLVLCVNPAFVPLWMKTPDLYGGEALNLLFAADVLTLSAGHALLVPIGVLGYRRAAGLLQLGASLVQVALAVGLGHRYGPPGVAAAGIVSTVLLVLPIGAVLLQRIIGPGGLRRVGRGSLRWAVRWLPLAVACWWAGRTIILRGDWGVLAAATAVTGLVYVAVMRPLFRELPWSGRMGALLRRVGVL